MSRHSPSMSSIKLGLLVAWSALWTGIPFKLVIALLFLAMGVHPWEMPGLAFLLVLSVPTDIWALNVAAKTVFLDRLRVKPPDSIGLALWWPAALISAIYLPIAYFIGSYLIAVAKSVAASMTFLQGLPVAERISIELILWGSVAIGVLLILVLGWLFLFGWIVRKRVSETTSADAPYSVLVRQWDSMRVPADQPLLLTAFVASGVALVLLFWAFLPATTPHPHEQYADKVKSKKSPPPFKPAEALQKSEKIIAKAEVAVETLEAKAEMADKEKDKGKTKGPSKESVSKVEPVKAMK